DHVDGAGRCGDHAALVVVDTGEAYVRVDLDARVTSDRDAMHAGTFVGRIRPVGACDAGQAVDVLHGDDGLAAAYSLDGEPDRGHPTRRHGHHGACDRFGCHPGLVSFSDIVEFDPEAVGQA